MSIIFATCHDYICCSKLLIKKRHLCYFLYCNHGILATVVPAFLSADALLTHLFTDTAASRGWWYCVQHPYRAFTFPSTGQWTIQLPEDEMRVVLPFAGHVLLWAQGTELRHSKQMCAICKAISKVFCKNNFLVLFHWQPCVFYIFIPWTCKIPMNSLQTMPRINNCTNCHFKKSYWQ